jgi:gamma-glutamylputrescine oxidase
VARPDIDDNVSWWWQSAAPIDPCPPLAGDVVADVVVLGAGFTGMSTAWHLNRARPDLRIVVLEAKRVANGASGRNGGMLLNWINGVDQSDEQVTRRVWACTQEAMATIEEVVRACRRPVRLVRDGCLEVQTDTRRAEAAHARVERLTGWGIPLCFLDAAALDPVARLRGAVSAILDPTAGRLHGVDLLRAMQETLLARGVVIHELSPAIAVEEGATVRVTTPRGSVRAPTLVLALNGYSGPLGYFRNEVFPLHSHMVALPAADVGWGVSGFSDDLDRIAYGTRFEDVLLFGGGSNRSYGYRWNGATTWHGSTEGPLAAVRRTVGAYLPGVGERPPVATWTGTLGITLSRCCSMGVRGEHRNVLYATGFAGHGLALANLAGRVLADIWLDRADPWRDLPFFQRSLGFIPGEPLRWLGYHAFTALTGRSPRRND